eukprot:12152037-Ditylum_brightwellii.AAC.1
MVKCSISTIFGVICVVIIIVIVSVVSHQPCPSKDTARSANTDPQATQNNPAPAGHNHPTTTTTTTMVTQRRCQML